MENIGTLIVVMVETGPFEIQCEEKKKNTYTYIPPQHNKGEKTAKQKNKTHSRLEVLGTVDHHFGSGK